MKIPVILALLFIAPFAWAQTPIKQPSMAITAPLPPGEAEKAVMDTEKQRFDAQVNKDYAVLDRILADDLVYNHSNGNSDNKQSYIQSIRDGKSKYDSMESLEQKVRLYGNTAIINGKVLIRATSNGEAINTILKYTDVYVRKGSQWQLVTWQSLRVPN